jgi:hypothetical protein
MKQLTDTDLMLEPEVKTHIYVLMDGDGAVRYVGKTRRILSYRLSSHLCDAKRRINGGCHRVNWIRSLLSNGLSPMIVLIETVIGHGSSEEIKWISHFRSIGAKLTNSTDGGECGRGKGIVFTDEHRANLSKAIKGRKLSEKTKELIRIARARQVIPARTKPHSIETRLRIKSALSSPEIREKIGLANRGRKRSQESRRKMSAAQLAAMTQERALKTAVLVKCVETGEVFRSCRLAAESVGGLRSLISRACARGMAHMGFHWVQL